MILANQSESDEFKNLSREYVLKIFTEPEIDHRESEAMQAILNDSRMVQHEKPLEKAQHEKGDYVSEAGIIERKAEDFFPSIQSGNIYKQVDGCYQTGKFYCLVCDNSFEYYAKHYEMYGVEKAMGAVARLATLGFPPIMTGRPEWTAMFIRAFTEKIRESVAYPIPRMVEVSRFGMLKIDGVAEMLGLKLLERFGSVKGVCSATIEELMEVEGIGKKKASSIFELVNRNWLQDVEK